MDTFKDVSIADANAYAELNPETEFIFIDGDEKVRFLTINEVNALTPKNLLRSDPCLTGDQFCRPHQNSSSLEVVVLEQVRIQ